MKKITSKGQLILYGISGLGVNLINMIVGSYLCSALLTGGFDKNIEFWTYLNRDLVVADPFWGTFTLWGLLIFIAKALDGIIDIPISAMTDNIKTRFGKRKTGILIGFVPMICAYLLFLVPLNDTASILNTVWFAALLMLFYASYTLTMLTYYATFSEIVAKSNDLMILSNTKSICDVIYFSLSFALVPAFVSMGINIRAVALIFLPLTLTMLIPLFLLKENGENEENAAPVVKKERVTILQSLKVTLKCRDFVKWLCVLFVMNFGLQLFLSVINEFFSTAGLNMTVVMATCFVPVPATIFLYNKIVKMRGLGFGYRYVLIMFSLGMGLMFFCHKIPQSLLLPMALFCSLLVSFAIGAFFSVVYTVPSHIVSQRRAEDGSGEITSTMFFAIQGLFEGISAGLASGIILVWLKQSGLISLMTLIVAGACMAACLFSFLLPKSITSIGKETKE